VPPPPPPRRQGATSTTSSNLRSHPSPAPQSPSRSTRPSAGQPLSGSGLPSRGPGNNSQRSPTTFGDPWNRKVRAIGVPHSTNPVVFQATLTQLESNIQTAVAFRDPVIRQIQPIGKPIPSKKFPGTTIITVQIEFTSVWAQRSALRRQGSLRQQHIQLLEEVPEAFRAERTHRLHLLRQLPKSSLPARVFGIDFYYLPHGDNQPPQPHEFRRGRWVWAPTFEELQKHVTQPGTPVHGHFTHPAGPSSTSPPGPPPSSPNASRPPPPPPRSAPSTSAASRAPVQPATSRPSPGDASRPSTQGTS
jgi:hypothetical protein